MDSLFAVVIAFLVLLLIVAAFWFGRTFVTQRIDNRKTIQDNLYLTSGTLSSAQVLTLGSAPTIAVPGVKNKILLFVGCFLRYIPGSIPYDDNEGGDNIILSYFTKDPPGASYRVNFSSTTKLLTSNVIRTATTAGDATSPAMPDVVGLPFYIRTGINTDPTGGNGTLEYYIYYKLLDPIAPAVIS